MDASHAANRPLLRFQGPADLPLHSLKDWATIPAGQLTLSGPSEQLDAAHWPVRGDLAHIRLAGRCFVPHYAVPMPHVVTAPGAALRKLAERGADVLEELCVGDGFDVLDMSGGWCWGQVAENGGGTGLVGYVPHDRLVPVIAEGDMP